MKEPRLPGEVSPVVPPCSAILAQERNVHGLVDLDTSNLNDALAGLTGGALFIPVDQTIVTDLLDQCIVLAGFRARGHPGTRLSRREQQQRHRKQRRGSER